MEKKIQQAKNNDKSREASDEGGFGFGWRDQKKGGLSRKKDPCPFREDLSTPTRRKRKGEDGRRFKHSGQKRRLAGSRPKRLEWKGSRSQQVVLFTGGGPPWRDEKVLEKVRFHRKKENLPPTWSKIKFSTIGSQEDV